MQKKANTMNMKINVASSMESKFRNFLWEYYGYKKDEEGQTIYEEETMQPVIDYDNITCWNEEHAPLAKELYEELEKTMMKWIEK